MSNYTPSTDFASKDSLLSGDPDKIVKGTEFAAEFSAIQTAIATKYDSGSVVPVSAGGTGATTASVARSNLGALGTADTAAKSTNLAGGLGGQIPYQSAADTTAFLANGTAGQFLQSSGGTSAPVWASVNQTQIQPISASVAGNALTISASALSLDFRSTTLGSGTVTRVSGTPSNLVISSGSTLGTVNNVQSDIIVLAINNAGTIELAAVNISGGNQLDETNLISTTAEGGAGAADSANVIYSTTARSSVAYRVIGLIRSTQTTAGTWATAPSTIQGQGGQALAAMSSLGYGQTPQNVSGSRALSTTYYNTTGKPIFVSVVTYAPSNVTAYHEITLTVNGVISDYCRQYFATETGSLNTQAIVPPGMSYSVASGLSIQYWTEWR